MIVKITRAKDNPIFAEKELAKFKRKYLAILDNLYMRGIKKKVPSV